MSFDAFTSGEIAAGQPVKQELWTKSKDNFDDLVARIVSLESSGLTAFPIEFSLLGEHAYIGAGTGYGYLRIAYNLTLTSAKIYVPIAGTSGTLELDVQKKTGGGAFASIFATKPSVLYSAGDHAVSSNAVLGTTALLTGDLLRLDMTQVMTGCKESHLYLTYTVD